MKGDGNPQIEDGYTKIVNELIEAFAKLKLSGNKWQIIWAIIRLTYGWGKKADIISLSQLSKMTGISCRNCLRELQQLERMRIISIVRTDNRKPSKIALNKHYNEWRVLSKLTIVKTDSRSAVKTDNSSIVKIDKYQRNIKESLKKDQEVISNDITSSSVSKKILLTEETQIKWQPIYDYLIDHKRFKIVYKHLSKKASLMKFIYDLNELYGTEHILEIQRELIKASQWCDDNSRRAPAKDFHRFLKGWLGRWYERYRKGLPTEYKTPREKRWEEYMEECKRKDKEEREKKRQKLIEAGITEVKDMSDDQLKVWLNENEKKYKYLWR